MLKNSDIHIRDPFVLPIVAENNIISTVPRDLKAGQTPHRVSIITPVLICKTGTDRSRRFDLRRASGLTATSGLPKSTFIADVITCSPVSRQKASAGGHKFWQPIRRRDLSCPSVQVRRHPVIGSVWMELCTWMPANSPGWSSATNGSRQATVKFVPSV